MAICGKGLGMKLLPRLILGLFVMAVCGCGDEFVEVETGYKGRARVNPWLAAERFAWSYGFEVESLAAWRAPEVGDAVWFVPASILNNESFIRRVEQWAGAGGHLVVLLEHAAAESNDWQNFEPDLPLANALAAMLQRLGIELRKDPADTSAEPGVAEVHFEDEEFKVAAKSNGTVAVEGGEPGTFASVRVGEGRVSVLTDARPLRNRWIADQDHPRLLLALIDAAEREGSVVFVRGFGLSFWGMLRRHLWPVLCGLAVAVALWLWKNLTRFGPLEAAVLPSLVRGYDHHLEALGNFHWRLDRAAALLAPLREQILERAQKIGLRSGRLDDELIQLLAARSGLPPERVSRALAEPVTADTVRATRVLADLQVLLKVLS
jgi:hypothetical protein